MKRLISSVIALTTTFLGSTGVCTAQEDRFTIAPFVGFRLGGDLRTDFGAGDVSIEDSVSYGVKLTIPIHSVNSFVESTEVEFLYNDETTFELGKFEVLTAGRDLLIISAGYMIHECNAAIDASWDAQYTDGGGDTPHPLSPLDDQKMLELCNEILSQPKNKPDQKKIQRFESRSN